LDRASAPGLAALCPIGSEDGLDDDVVFALLRSYEAGVSDGWRAAQQPEQPGKERQAEPEALRCPMGSTPQRQALFRRMFAVRMAIAIWRPSLFNLTGTLWNIPVAWRAAHLAFRS
jgi:hypothetical protein